jgi:hypothetical protein
MLLIRNYVLPIVPSILRSAFENVSHNDSRSKEPALSRSRYRCVIIIIQMPRGVLRSVPQDKTKYSPFVVRRFHFLRLSRRGSATRHSAASALASRGF